MCSALEKDYFFISRGSQGKVKEKRIRSPHRSIRIHKKIRLHAHIIILGIRYLAKQKINLNSSSLSRKIVLNSSLV